MDNSEWMRNGDYTPTRFQAQADAVNLICGAKTQVSLFTCIRACFVGFFLVIGTLCLLHFHYIVLYLVVGFIICP